MTTQSFEVPGDVAIKVCIGDVCLQWARLEMTMIALICQIEPMETEKAYIIFGGLDIVPRANMAINLARYNKLPTSLVKRITAIRKALQGGLDKRRNQVVHGAHRETQGAEVTLTMVRWQGEKRHQKLSSQDISLLAKDVHDLGTEVWSTCEAVFLWSARHHMQENFDNPFA